MPRLVLLSLLLVSSSPAAHQAPALNAPTALVAAAASRSVVSLSWTTGDPAVTRFVVERKPLGASWTPPAPPAKPVVVTLPATSTTLEDKSIDAYATYVPETKGTPTSGETSPVLAIVGSSRTYIAFRTAGEGGGLKRGILLWRER